MNENVSIFNDWKQRIENVLIQSPIDCLRIVEVNISNICNLRCPFCPQSINPHYEVDYADISMLQLLADHLHSINYAGYICVAGHGEPTLHPQFLRILHMLHDFNVVVVTNGTQFSNQTWSDISQLCQIKVSIHDWANRRNYFEKFAGTNAIFRNHDMLNPQMNIYNRAGQMADIKNHNDIFRRCNYPFYKIMVDVDGTYLICEADWLSNSKTYSNVANTSVHDYFCNNLSNVRKMMNNGRNNIACCAGCNIDGQMIGNKFVDHLMNQET